MKKSIIINRITKIIMIVFVFLVLFYVLFFRLSPYPSIFILSRFFDQPVKITNSKMYEQNRSQVKFIRNQRYGNSKSELFDIVKPKSPKDCHDAVLIWIHGGGFIGGDKTGADEFLTNIVSKSHISGVNMNYEVAPSGKFPTQLHQVNKMIRHLEKKKILGKHTKIILGGDSAGAQIAAQYGTIQTNNNYRKKFNNIKADKYKIIGLILYCGPYDMKEIYHQTKQHGSLLIRWFVHTVGWSMVGNYNWYESPKARRLNFISQITKDYPSPYITDGNSMSFEESGKELVKKIESKGIRVKKRFFDSDAGKVSHEYQFNFSDPKAIETFKETTDYLKSLIKK